MGGLNRKMKQTVSTDETGTRAVKRAADLLRAVARADETCTVTELARQTDLSKATAHRILKTLTAENFVDFDAETGRYAPGKDLINVILSGGRSNVISALYDLEKISSAFIRDLSAESRETSVVVIRRSDFRINLTVELGSHELNSMPKVGAQHPIHLGGPGKVVLAEFTEPQLEAYVARVALGAHPLSLTPAFRDELRQIRLVGYATSSGEAVAGQASIAAPIRYGDRFIAALNLIVPTVRYDAEKSSVLIPRVLAAAGSISSMLAQHWNYKTAIWE